MSDLTDAELAKLEKTGARTSGLSLRASHGQLRAIILRLVAEVRRRRAEQPKGKTHELTERS